MSELEEKLNETIKALDHKIAKNIADLDSLKASSKEYVNELRGYEAKKYQFYPQQYVAKSFLHLMHSSDDDGLRPNPVQSYKSAAIQLFDDKDTEVSKVKPETRYTCRCIVSNRGDLAAPIANVEYFINKEKEREQLTVCWSAKEAVYKWYGAGGMDFRQHMHLQPFPLLNYGTIQCLFRKDQIEKTLSVFYQVENGFVVAWLVDTTP